VIDIESSPVHITGQPVRTKQQHTSRE